MPRDGDGRQGFEPGGHYLDGYTGGGLGYAFLIIFCESIFFDKEIFTENKEDIIATTFDLKNKHLIIAGLDGDFNREPFGDIVRLIPQAEKVTKLSALCIICSDGTPANFSKRISASKNKILVGSTDDYIAVCRGCYFKE